MCLLYFIQKRIFTSIIYNFISYSTDQGCVIKFKTFNHQKNVYFIVEDKALACFVKHHIESLNGSIDVDSTVNKSTRFTIRFD
jgi:hypothetical protein